MKKQLAPILFLAVLGAAMAQEKKPVRPIDALKARCEDRQPVQMHLSLSVRKTKDGGYFTEVNAYPEDTAYRVPREY